MLFKKKRKYREKAIDLEYQFEAIYEKYWELIYAICLNRTNNMEVAREMTQDIFLSLWERKDTLKIKFIKNYLIRSAKQRVFEHFRNLEIKKRNLKLVTEETPVSENATENQVAISLLEQEVHSLVGQLPDDCRKVYKMSREQGLPNKKIAELLKVTERTVENRISRALKHLQNNLSTGGLA